MQTVDGGLGSLIGPSGELLLIETLLPGDLELLGRFLGDDREVSHAGDAESDAHVSLASCLRSGRDEGSRRTARSPRCRAERGRLLKTQMRAVAMAASAESLHQAVLPSLRLLHHRSRPLQRRLSFKKETACTTTIRRHAFCAYGPSLPLAAATLPSPRPLQDFLLPG